MNQQTLAGVDANRFIVRKPKDKIAVEVGLNKMLGDNPLGGGRFQSLLPVKIQVFVIRSIQKSYTSSFKY